MKLNYDLIRNLLLKAENQKKQQFFITIRIR